MPNWTTNKMMIHSGKDLRRILNRKGDVDFNRLRRMPKPLDIGDVSLSANRFAMAAARGEVSGMDAAPVEWLRRRLRYHDGKRNRDIDIEKPTLYDYRVFGEMLLENKERYGHASWYGWCAAEEGWGTKWNACESSVGEPDDDGYCLVEFRTAWSCPSSAMLDELRAKCEHPIRFECVDEDGWGDVHDDKGNRIEVGASLFRPAYENEDGKEIGEEEYLQAKRDGVDVWRRLV